MVVVLLVEVEWDGRAESEGREEREEEGPGQETRLTSDWTIIRCQDKNGSFMVETTMWEKEAPTSASDKPSAEATSTK